jgi:4-amino-4-deoxy-L-arabinose transferase-like glycosyltransferase
MTIVAPPETSHAREAIGRALAWTTDAFPRYRNVDEYRLRMAGFLSVVWLVQLCTYALARRWLGRRARLGSALVALTLCWVAVAAWLGTVYFAV